MACECVLFCLWMRGLEAMSQLGAAGDVVVHTGAVCGVGSEEEAELGNLKHSAATPQNLNLGCRARIAVVLAPLLPARRVYVRRRHAVDSDVLWQGGVGMISIDSWEAGREEERTGDSSMARDLDSAVRAPFDDANTAWPPPIPCAAPQADTYMMLPCAVRRWGKASCVSWIADVMLVARILFISPSATSSS